MFCDVVFDVHIWIDTADWHLVYACSYNIFIALVWICDHWQMEFYFSDANLHKDRFLNQQLQQTSDGCEIYFHDIEFFSS